MIATSGHLKLIIIVPNFDDSSFNRSGVVVWKDRQTDRADRVYRFIYGIYYLINYLFTYLFSDCNRRRKIIDYNRDTQ